MASDRSMISDFSNSVTDLTAYAARFKALLGMADIEQKLNWNLLGDLSYANEWLELVLAQIERGGAAK